MEMEDAPAPNVMERDAAELVQSVRKGVTIHGETEAKPYADSLEFKKSNHTRSVLRFVPLLQLPVRL